MHTHTLTAGVRGLHGSVKHAPSMIRSNVIRSGTTSYSTIMLALIVCLMLAQGGWVYGTTYNYHTLLSAYYLCLLLACFTTIITIINFCGGIHLKWNLHYTMLFWEMSLQSWSFVGKSLLHFLVAF